MLRRRATGSDFSNYFQVSGVSPTLIASVGTNYEIAKVIAHGPSGGGDPAAWKAATWVPTVRLEGVDPAARKAATRLPTGRPEGGDPAARPGRLQRCPTSLAWIGLIVVGLVISVAEYSTRVPG